MGPMTPVMPGGLRDPQRMDGFAMAVFVDTSGSMQGFEHILEAALSDCGDGSLLIFGCEANAFTPERLDPILRRVDIPVIGGTFPAILHGLTRLDKGTLIATVPTRADCILIDHLSDESLDFVEAIDRQMKGEADFRTVVIWADGFARRINELIYSLFTVFGLEYNYIGGGAGGLSMQSKPCVLTNQGLKADAALVAMLDCPSSVGVCHGWTSMAGPFRITESRGNLVKTIEWRPAFELYRDVLLQYAKAELNRENFFTIAKGYPFGIAKLDAEPLVRDPVRVTPEGHLICAGDVPEGNFVDILSGDADSLLEATRTARRRRDHLLPSGLTNPLNLFIDCISRVLFLGDRYPEEIRAAFTPDGPMIGACTIGEIANTGNDYIEFYNKTAVLGVLGGA
jgi:hypothetical protein